MTAVRVEYEGGAAAWFAGTLAVQSVHGHRLPPTRSYGPIRVFFQASCSWQSECLFGQSFPIAPPIQALGWLPCLGSVSVVPWHFRHIERLSWMGSYPVYWHIRYLKGHPGSGPTLLLHISGS